MRILTVAAAALAAGAIAFGAHTTARTEMTSAQNEFNITDKMTAGDSAKLGEWQSVCAAGQPLEELHAASIDLLEQGECHLRYVDIFKTGGHAANPSGLGMIAAFIAPEKKGVRVEFGIAPGLSFDVGGFHLLRDGFAVWKLDKYDCLADGVCTFSGPAAQALVTAFSDATAKSLEMKLDFTDSTGQRHSRQWSMMPFSEAFADFAAKQNPPMM